MERSLMSPLWRRLRGVSDDRTEEATRSGGDSGVGDAGEAITDGGAPSAATTEQSSREDGDELNIDDDVLLDGVGLPVFMLDASGDIVAWNRSMESLTGLDGDQASDESDVATALYGDGGEEALAQRVLVNPERANQNGDVELSDETLSLYCQEERASLHGERFHLEHTAMPLYEDGDLVAVMQTIRDRTPEVKRHEDIADLVDEVQATLRDLTDGELASRANYDDAERVIDDQLLVVVDELNAMADQFEQLTARVDEETATLETAVEEAANAAGEIETNVDAQNDLLEDGVDGIQTFSSTMEEVAATANSVSKSASQARSAASDGEEASEDAREATEDVVEIGDELVESVTHLSEDMEEIEAVIEVISDVAEQTNMLALNANIEAARAGDDGNGFAVVAEEVKALADETHQHTEEVTSSIEAIQSRTNSTVDAVTDSRQRIDEASGQIEEVLTALDEIAHSIDDAADGIAEVSDVTEDQAETITDLTGTLEGARERARQTEAATVRIAEATDEQTAIIDDLSAQIDSLRGDRD